MLEKLIEDQKNKKTFEFVATKNSKDFTIEESRNLTENFLTELNMSEEYKARFRELSESLHQGNNN
jgi:transcription initiation factor TFIIIB Brf1 subunit/transcription initiation factor TFIIB